MVKIHAKSIIFNFIIKLQKLKFIYDYTDLINLINKIIKMSTPATLRDEKFLSLPSPAWSSTSILFKLKRLMVTITVIKN